MPLTDEWIEEQLKLCEEATAGPWGSYPRWFQPRYDDATIIDWNIECSPDLPGFRLLGSFESEANASLVAAAREGYPLVLEWLQELRAEMDAIRYAAHMPDDYEFGLPSWINQHLYGELIALRDADGGPISRSEDIEEIRRLRDLLAQEDADASTE